MQFQPQRVINPSQLQHASNTIFDGRMRGNMIKKSYLKDASLASIGAGMGALAAGVTFPYIVSAMIVMAFIVIGAKHYQSNL